ncbi:pyridoxal phosphate-dependent aminotransferase family protein [Cytophagaceae bacterium ABcell3]|nr:pyridoxal phosphate-dependent aminotransferase family protein [Cytophagaceae bacterium ABcell3]
MEKLHKKLIKRKEAGNIRNLSINPNLKDFYSNDYLGLARNRVLFEKICQASGELAETNINGSTGSRLLSGNSLLAQDLESKLAKIFKTEKCLLFNSGYNANLSILSCVPQKGDTIILDELIHASLKESARLSFANHFTFKHNNLQHLEQKIRRASGEVFVVVESIYSMDGDMTPVKEMIDLCQKYNAHIIVDEAHSTGILGEKGNGLVCSLGLEEYIFARIHTFGKAMGVHGACIAGSETLIDYLINFARPFIYTTALPPHSLISIEEAFKYLQEHEKLQTIIGQKTKKFSQTLMNVLPNHYNFKQSDTPIHVIKVSGNEKAKHIAKNLQKDGFDVRPILSPTVKKGEERLRVCLHIFNTDEDIDQLSSSIVKALNI